MDNYHYSLIDAKVFTNEEITLYLKKQGIHLERDGQAENANLVEFNGWSGLMEGNSDFQEIYTHTKYNPNSNKIEYEFPVDKIENTGYTLYHNVQIINKNGNSRDLNVYFQYKNNAYSPVILTTTMTKTQLVKFKITCKLDNTATVISYIVLLRKCKYDIFHFNNSSRVFDLSFLIIKKMDGFYPIHQLLIHAGTSAPFAVLPDDSIGRINGVRGFSPLCSSSQFICPRLKSVLFSSTNV